LAGTVCTLCADLHTSHNGRFDEPQISSIVTSAPSVKFRNPHPVSALIPWRLSLRIEVSNSTSIAEIHSSQNPFIFLRPFAEERHRLRELRSRWCQGVVDVWRHNRMNEPIEKSPAFQFSQGLGQHLPRNVWDGTLEFVETSSTPLETEQNDWRPGVCNDS